jgi:hypothetical protein
LLKNYIRLIIDPKLGNIPELKRFYESYKKYRSLNGSEEINISDFYPCINDNIPTTPFDAHYFYQGVWAFSKIKESGVKNHIDVVSEISRSF